eukprot:3926969-Prymnesium_polylepis.1
MNSARRPTVAFPLKTFMRRTPTSQSAGVARTSPRSSAASYCGAPCDGRRGREPPNTYHCREPQYLSSKSSSGRSQHQRGDDD